MGLAFLDARRPCEVAASRACVRVTPRLSPAAAAVVVVVVVVALRVRRRPQVERLRLLLVPPRPAGKQRARRPVAAAAAGGLRPPLARVDGGVRDAVGAVRVEVEARGARREDGPLRGRERRHGHRGVGAGAVPASVAGVAGVARREGGEAGGGGGPEEEGRVEGKGPAERGGADIRGIGIGIRIRITIRGVVRSRRCSRNVLLLLLDRVVVCSQEEGRRIGYRDRCRRRAKAVRGRNQSKEPE